MAYNEFAYFYDEFNGEADYDALYEQIRQELNAHDIRDGILADLGCGTGELTLMLTQAGYDMIGIDQSEEMLCVVRDAEIIEDKYVFYAKVKVKGYGNKITSGKYHLSASMTYDEILQIICNIDTSSDEENE